MTWSVAARKKSGNGTGNLNLAEGGKLRVRGTLYSIKEYEAVVNYIDDDRFDFCGNTLQTGSFWCTAEMYDIVGSVSQNCENVGVTMAKTNSTSNI